MANRVEGGKRPRSSMAPTIVYDAQGPRLLVVGSPGGRAIINYVAKTLIGVLDWGIDPQAAVDCPTSAAATARPIWSAARAPQRSRPSSTHGRCDADRRPNQRTAGSSCGRLAAGAAPPIRAAKGRCAVTDPTSAPMATAAAGPHRIVIVGGGAGGLPLATALGDKLGRRGTAAITLVDRAETHVWKPLLHEVAAGRMDADAHDVDYLADRALAPVPLPAGRGRRPRSRAPRAHGSRRSMTTTAGRSCRARAVPYDTLVVCIGSAPTTSACPASPTHAISLDTPLDAERFHRRLLAACVRADGEAAEGRPAHVDIVIIGAGATGVELAAEIRQTTRAHAGYGLEKLDPGARHPPDVARGRAAHPAAARRADCEGGDRTAWQARHRRAHRRARGRRRCRRRAHRRRRSAAAPT